MRLDFQPPLPPDMSPDYEKFSYCGGDDCCMAYTCHLCGTTEYWTKAIVHFNDAHNLLWGAVKHP